MSYEKLAAIEMKRWQARMQKQPGILDKLSRKAQTKINNLIPEKIHQAITVAIQQMTEAVLFGAKYTSGNQMLDVPLLFREKQLEEKLRFYRNTASAEGVITGAGGFLTGLTDFPLLLAIKMKFLFDAAGIYGFDVHDYKERLYILYIFQLAFSSQESRIETYRVIESWQDYSKSLPPGLDEFNWRSFQQEYRDYIDLVKMAQLLPFVGAAVGAVANYKLLEQLGDTAKNAYRMRILKP